jgi:hypothetical protein
MSIDHGCSSILAAMVARDCPTHVLVNRKVKADLRVASRAEYGIETDAIFIRRNGWSLGGTLASGEVWPNGCGVPTLDRDNA